MLRVNSGTANQDSNQRERADIVVPLGDMPWIASLGASAMPQAARRSLLRRFSEANSSLAASTEKMSLTLRNGDVALHLSQCSSVSEFSMDEIVDRALHTYGLTNELDAERMAQSREKIIRYIDKLGAAGQNDAHQLIVYALAYLKELHEGPDPRFTGC